MKYFAIFLLFSMAIIVFATFGVSAQLAAREQVRITAEGIPECLHVGDRIEALVSADTGEMSDKVNLTIGSQRGRVSATPLLANGLYKPITVVIRGKKFGRDSITLSVSDRPDIEPLTAKFRVLPSFEPPQGLTAQPTKEFMHVAPCGEGGGTDLFRKIIFKWRPKAGVKFFWLQMLDDQRRSVGGSRAEGGVHATTDYTAPGEQHFGRIRAVIGTCAGEDVWTPYGPMVPFDS